MTDTIPAAQDTTAEVEAVASAASFAAPILAATTDATRAEWLRAVASALEGAAPELVRVAERETALGEGRLSGEVGRTTHQLRMFAEVIEEGAYLEAIIDHADPAAGQPRPDLRRMLRPLGPVAVFAASNFPFAFSVAGGDTASALAVGCPVVVKIHPGHEELSRATASIVKTTLAAAGAPDGTFATVSGHDAGVALVQHPHIQAAAFTGSLNGGRALADLAAAREAPIPFFGELGSINPVVVTRAADRARGAELGEGLAGSFQLGTGQFCTKPGLVFVPEDSLVEKTLRALIGSRPHRMLTPSIAAGFHAGVADLLAVPGVERVLGGQGGVGAEAVPVVVATSVGDLARHSDALFAEVFGPVTVLIRYRDEGDVARALDALHGSLTATLHAEPDDDVSKLLAKLERIAGRILFAGWPTGVAVNWAQHHGGPWPSTTSQHTSVGASATRRFQRPIAYQDAPEHLLPAALRDGNPLGIPRRVDGALRLGR